ncbi:MAG: hypothetical protein ABT940_14635, partial [Alphaproteobacteria bacterium]
MDNLLSYPLIILVSLLFYYKTWNYYYVSDDLPVAAKVEPNPIGRIHALWIQFTGQRYFNYNKDWNLRNWCTPKTAHIITWALHTLNCCLIHTAFGVNKVSLLAGLYFAINPAHTQGGAIWISGKPYSTATTLALAMYALPWAAPAFYYGTTLFSANAML